MHPVHAVAQRAVGWQTEAMPGWAPAQLGKNNRQSMPPYTERPNEHVEAGPATVPA